MDPLTEANDEILFHRFQTKNDDKAIEILVNRYEKQVIGFITSRIKDPETAEEIWMETLMRIVRNKNNFDPSKKFSTWVNTIASRLMYNHARNRKQRRTSTFSEIQKIDQNQPRFLDQRSKTLAPDEKAYGKELDLAIKETIEKLEEIHSEPMKLRFIEDLNYEDISKILDIPVGTVKSRIKRARILFIKNFPFPV
jgi:RNA polymerase sigma-70 factor, ECF subfamily